LLASTSSNANDVSIPLHQALEEARVTGKRVKLSNGKVRFHSSYSYLIDDQKQTASADPLDLLGPLLGTPPSREELQSLTSRLNTLETRFSSNELKLRNLSQICISSLPNLKKRLEDSSISTSGISDDKEKEDQIKEVKDTTTSLTNQLTTLQNFIHTSHTSVLSTLETSKQDIKSVQSEIRDLKSEMAQLKIRIEGWENTNAQSLVANEEFIKKVAKLIKDGSV
jgi:hypothetical protein